MAENIMYSQRPILILTRLFLSTMVFEMRVVHASYLQAGCKRINAYLNVLVISRISYHKPRLRRSETLTIQLKLLMGL